jgi:tetratricopeptide (TPR) repeat protein
VTAEHRPFYRLLGRVRVDLPDGSKLVATRDSRLRIAMLALLLLRTPEAVPTSVIIDEVYAHSNARDPRKAVKRLARLLRESLGDQELPHGLGGGYALRDPGDLLDTRQFLTRHTAAVTARLDGDPTKAVRLWNGALALWRESIALQDLQQFEFARRAAEVWADHRLRAVIGLLDALRELGYADEVDRVLDRESALFPRQLADWHRRTGHGIVVVPALPGEEPLIGRQHIVDELFAGVAGAWQTGKPSPYVVRISGPAGIGVSTVVGRLLAMLSAAGGRVCHTDIKVNPLVQVSTEGVRTSLFAALGVAPDDLPESAAERAELYRAVLADVAPADRLVLVFDHVARADQVASLLPPPGAPVTLILGSRPDLTDLPAARVVELDPITHAHAMEVLRRFVGAEAVSRHRNAASRLVEVCDRNPQFIAIAGTKVIGSGQTLTEYVEWVKNLPRQEPDLDVAHILEYSVRDLPALHQAMFALLGRLRADTIPAARAAAMLDADTNVAIATATLEGLVEARLLAVDPDGRYRVPRILGGYARSLPLPDGLWPKAFQRVMRALLDEVREMAGQVNASPAPGAGPRLIPVLDWYDAECGNLAAAVEQAVLEEQLALAWRLVDVLTPILCRTAAVSDWSHVVNLAQTAADRLGDPHARALILMSRAEMGRYQGDFEASRRDYDAAVGILDTATPGDDCALARALDGRADLGIGVAVTSGDDSRWASVEADARRSYDLYIKASDRSGAASALASLSELLALSGRDASAEEVSQRCLALYRSVPDPANEAVALRILGSIQLRLHRPTNAHDTLIEALELNRRLGTQLEEGRTLVKLGEIESVRDNVEAAEDWYQAALAILERRHDLRWRAAARMRYGELLLRTDTKRPSAAKLIVAARDVFRQIHDDASMTRCDGLLRRLK